MAAPLSDPNDENDSTTVSISSNARRSIHPRRPNVRPHLGWVWRVVVTTVAIIMVMSPGAAHADGKSDLAIKIDMGDWGRYFKSLDVSLRGVVTWASVPVEVNGKEVATILPDPVTGVMNEDLTVQLDDPTESGGDTIGCDSRVVLRVNIDGQKWAVIIAEGANPTPDEFAETVQAVFTIHEKTDDTTIGCNAVDPEDCKSIQPTTEVIFDGRTYWLNNPTVYPVNPCI